MGIALEKFQEKKVSVLFFLKSILFAYILTAMLLMLLALLLYKAGIGANIVSLSIIVIYVASAFFAGFLAGKKMQNKKFLWGLAMGGLYFLVLAVASLMANRSVGEMGNSFFTTMALCAGGGMLGGMMG